MPRPRRRIVVERGGIHPGVLPEVKELFALSEKYGVPILEACRALEIHHSVPNRWRRGQSTPTLRLYSQIRAYIVARGRAREAA